MGGDAVGWGGYRWGTTERSEEKLKEGKHGWKVRERDVWKNGNWWERMGGI